MALNGAIGIFVVIHPDIADILGRTDLDFDNLYFFYVLDPTFLDFQVPRSPNFWIVRSPDLQIPRFPNSQISWFPDFQTPPPGEFSDPNLTPLPTHPGIKYVARALAAVFLGSPFCCPSVRPSAVRPSVRRPSAVRPSAVRPSAVRPSVRPSVRPPPPGRRVDFFEGREIQILGSREIQNCGT